MDMANERQITSRIREICVGLKGPACLTAAFLLVKHFDYRHHADEINFCRRVRNQLRKALPGRKMKGAIEHAVRDLVDDAVESEGVVDRRY